MNNIVNNVIVNQMPRMLFGEELTEALKVMPEYDPTIIKADPATRLAALNDIYDVYVPGTMSTEIYSKLYLAISRSLQKKQGKLAVRQSYENFKAIHNGGWSRNVVNSGDSFTIIGKSGIGKSATISHALDVMEAGKVILQDRPFCKVIPAIIVQCPFDASVKSLLSDIIGKLDDALGTDYVHSIVGKNATTDVLINATAQLCMNHVGLLVIDEIQNVIRSKAGRNLLGMLVQLVNSSGISICLVGVPSCIPFFESEMHMARRASGLTYEVLTYGDDFKRLCNELWGYKYTQNADPIDEAMHSWLYQHTGGVVAIVSALLHDAQESAILDGSDRLGKASLEKAYRQRLYMLREYVETEIKLPSSGRVASKEKKTLKQELMANYDEKSQNVRSYSEILKQTGNAPVVQILEADEILEEVEL